MNGSSLAGVDEDAPPVAGAAGKPKVPKLIPEKEGKGIFACSKSSIGGRSSSRAEYRPFAFGGLALELL